MSAAFLTGLGIGLAAGIVAGFFIAVFGALAIDWLMSERAWPWRAK